MWAYLSADLPFCKMGSATASYHKLGGRIWIDGNVEPPFEMVLHSALSLSLPVVLVFFRVTRVRWRWPRQAEALMGFLCKLSVEDLRNRKRGKKNIMKHGVFYR